MDFRFLFGDVCFEVQRPVSSQICVSGSTVSDVDFDSCTFANSPFVCGTANWSLNSYNAAVTSLCTVIIRTSCIAVH